MVNKVRRLLKGTKVGHLGTLDPMSTGVLPLVVGKATRLAQFYKANEKVYEAEITFGYSTDTYDAMGEVVHRSVATIDEDAIMAVLPRFRGELLQVPPAVSAKKIEGKRAYELAREGKPVELAAVPVTVHALDVMHLRAPVLRARIHCSAGTYIRSIAHDMGEALGCGATLTALRRTRSGGFGIERAYTVEQIAGAAQDGRWEGMLIPAVELLPHFPIVRVDEVTAGFIRQGRSFRGIAPLGADVSMVRAVGPDGTLLAIAKEVFGGMWHPEVVL